MFNECRQFQALRRSDPIAGKGTLQICASARVRVRAVTVTLLPQT